MHLENVYSVYTIHTVYYKNSADIFICIEWYVIPNIPFEKVMTRLNVLKCFRLVHVVFSTHTQMLHISVAKYNQAERVR